MKRAQRRFAMIGVLAALIVVNVLVLAAYMASKDGSRDGTGDRALDKDSGAGPTINGSDEEPDITEDVEGDPPDEEGKD